MANYVCAARTNYFRVKDRNKFDAWVKDHGYRSSGGDEGLICLMPGDSDDGAFERDYDEEKDEYTPFSQMLAPFLADGEVAIIMEAGAEKLRYIVGHAVAVNNKGETTDVSLREIYDRAKPLGQNITECEY